MCGNDEGKSVRIKLVWDRLQDTFFHELVDSLCDCYVIPVGLEVDLKLAEIERGPPFAEKLDKSLLHLPDVGFVFGLVVGR